ncbi:MAG: 16S rRNA (guanine(527)-N(7))-methyltransferase RsmG [Lachnospiraceae bacterium]|nr:16S rRNA (guanine(527)-N(7))-methyltransferase RsmG [Lachnospiraceae bacterium]
MQLHIEITDEQLDKFALFENMVLEWNSVMNLTRITEEDEMISRHFIDSICLVKGEKYLNKSLDESFTVLDMGTGAGFPGIPLRIMFPEIKLTLVDSLEKRCRFLLRLVDELGFRNVEVLHSRAEDFGKRTGRREYYDVCISRAVAKLPVLTEYTLPYVKLGGQAVYYKGFGIENEVQSSKRAVKLLGGKYPVHIVKYTLPDTDEGRSLVIVDKISDTPDYYPRKAGLPDKSPIST